MRLLFLILAVACVAAGILFGALNPQSARVDFYWFALDGALGAMLLAAAFAGALAAGLVLHLGVIWPLRGRLRRAQRRAALDAAPPPDALPESAENA